MSGAAIRRGAAVGALGLAASCIAVASMVSSPRALDAASPAGTYTAPFQPGPTGGDSHNVVNENAAQGRVTVVRLNPLVGAFNCAGQGGYADLRVATAVPVTTSAVTVRWAGQSAIDAYTWITLLVRDAGGNWLGGVQRRGPMVGAGALGTTLTATLAPGTPVTVQFGVQVASACPNVDAGSVQFSSVTLGTGVGAAPPLVGVKVPRANAAGAQNAAARPAIPAVKVPHTESVVTAAGFTFIPGDDDTPQAPLRVLVGSNLLFVNPDPLAPHTVTALQNGPSGAPLFDSGAPTGGGGGFSNVAGVSTLAAGVYDFYCRVHTQMRGVLRVLAVGAVRGHEAFISW